MINVHFLSDNTTATSKTINYLPIIPTTTTIENTTNNKKMCICRVHNMMSYSYSHCLFKSTYPHNVIKVKVVIGDLLRTKLHCSIVSSIWLFIFEILVQCLYLTVPFEKSIKDGE